MIVGTVEMELMLPAAHSLKEKRAVLNRLKDRVRARFNASVAETEHHDLWQRARIGVAIAGHEGTGLRDLLEAVRRHVEQDDRVVVLDSVIDIR